MHEAPSVGVVWPEYVVATFACMGSDAGTQYGAHHLSP